LYFFAKNGVRSSLSNASVIITIPAINKKEIRNNTSILGAWINSNGKSAHTVQHQATAKVLAK
jgi:hypothetical protein